MAMTDWLLVAGDFTPFGGMDVANYGLASYLGRQGAGEVHLVGHRVSPDLMTLPSVRVHRAARPFSAHRLGEPVLRMTAKLWQRRLSRRPVRIVANGGNVDAGDVNWVHYVHGAYRPRASGYANRLGVSLKHRRYVRQERVALRRARVIVCNSQRTADDVVQCVGVDRDRTRVVYYGVDDAKFRPVNAEERAAARFRIGVHDDRPVALFVGALGDRRKGFDVLFTAWRDLCRTRGWDGPLLVAGGGAELTAWCARAATELPAHRMRFLGFRRDVATLLAASDLLIHPVRYEAYGMAVHEALCRGIPAVVSANAGIAERYPDELRDLLIGDPESASELTARLLAWRSDSSVKGIVARWAERLRARTWDHMASDIVTMLEAVSA
jgi:glycosyltransferase involved in cell wall biosynthesis